MGTKQTTSCVNARFRDVTCEPWPYAAAVSDLEQGVNFYGRVSGTELMGHFNDRIGNWDMPCTEDDLNLLLAVHAEISVHA
jgi:hypothetical protein